MSLSPTKESSSDEVREYDVGWAATNKLIRQGRAFSGGERNCAFLNIAGSGRFATVSGATGLDLIDDGRGLAICDWDYDGRVDFWLTNRTGPRLRFLHNRYVSGNGFLALLVQGVTANRDGIGARISVEIEDQEAPMVRTVYAGNGYLSQSSKWQHFGIPAGARVGGVRVRWPGGAEEHFTGAAEGGFFKLEQGKGNALAWQPPRFPPEVFDAEPLPPVEDGGAARVLPITRGPLPESLTYIDAEGVERRLAEHFGKPLLIQLWATWCPNCEAEMAEWRGMREQIASTGATVLPVCVDEPGAERGADLAAAAEAVAERDYPWSSGLANARLIEHLNTIQKNYIGRQEDLPLPSMFLIDAEGRVAAIYKGGIAPETVIGDLAVAGAGVGREAITRRALPYPGQWLEQPPGTMPRGIAIALVEHGLNEDAELYLGQLMRLYAEPAAGAGEEAEATRVRELSECHGFLGAIRYDAGEKEAAAEHYLAALELSPGKRKLREELMRCYVDLGQPDAAARQVEAMLEERPDDFENLAQLARLRAMGGDPEEALALYRRSLVLRDHPETHNALANQLRDLGRGAEALPHYRAALEGRPGWPLPANNLAWLLAAHPDPGVRDGAEALRWATAASAATGDEVPPILSTLAAAQAEAGDFTASARTLRRAIELADGRGDAGLLERLRERLALVESGEPIRDASLLPKAP